MSYPLNGAQESHQGSSSSRKRAREVAAGAEGASQVIVLLLLTNFVIVMTDDQRSDTIGTAHGLGGPAMPIVQALADQGMTFNGSHTVISLCAPSRASLLSGLYSHNHGVYRNGELEGDPHGGVDAFDDTSTLATWLLAEDYRTALIGKYINQYAGTRVPPGWTDWHAFSGEPGYYDYVLSEQGVLHAFGHADSDYSTDVVMRKAAQFIRDTGSQPFFLLVTPFAPHAPSIPAPRHIGAFGSLPHWRPPNWNEDDVSDKPKWVRDLPKFTQSKINDIDDSLRLSMEADLAVDEGMGGIMEALADTGHDADTMVIFTSDNGFAFGEHRWDYKVCPYEECMRVPLVIWYPSLLSPGQDSHLVLNIDLAPTIAELAGAAVPAINGSSLLGLFSGGQWRDAYLGEHWATPGKPMPRDASIFDGRWVLVDYDTQTDELYDLNADQYELQNVGNLPQNAGIKAGLAARLAALREE